MINLYLESDGRDIKATAAGALLILVWELILLMKVSIFKQT